jgi:uncharacterized protein YciI/quercetin dioxygenase-like cupin family protein
VTEETLVDTNNLDPSDWQTFEKFELKQYVLWEHPETGATITLLDFPKGSGIPTKHSHASNQFMYCLEGKYEYTDSKLVLGPGSFYSNPKDHPHGPTIAHERSVLIEIYDGPHYYDMPDYHTDSTIGRLVNQQADTASHRYLVVAVAGRALPDAQDDVDRAHLDFLKGLRSQGGTGSLGGALGNEAHSKTIGATYIVHAESLDEARDIASRDPYAESGYYQDVQVYPWRLNSS